MKKLFTFFAVMMMAITASAGNTEDLIAAMGYKIFYTSKGGAATLQRYGLKTVF